MRGPLHAFPCAVAMAAALSLLPWAAAPAQTSDPIATAKHLIATGHSRAAYRLLAPLETARAGDPDFDYLLGIAALDSGKPGRAVIALERVLTVDPNHLPARAEIARAYMELGERRTAKQEFEQVRAARPPPAVAATVDRYLAALSSQAGPARLRGYVEVGGGYDTNVNSATSQSQISIPAFGGAVATLGAGGTSEEDGFMRMAAGLDYAHPLTGAVTFLAGMRANLRRNARRTDFDTGTFDGHVGLARQIGERDTLTGAIQAQDFEVGGGPFRQAWGLTLQWRHVLDPSTAVSVYGQGTRLRYPHQRIRDATRTVAGFGIAHQYEGRWKPSVYAGAYIGNESERQTGVPYLGHHFAGLRAGGSLHLDAHTTPFLSVSFEDRNYGGKEPLFLRSRGDRQIDVRLGASYQIRPDLVVTPSYAYTRNQSNISVDDYSRHVVEVDLRYSFE